MVESKIPKRLATELKDITDNPPEGVIVQADTSNQLKWIVYMGGPKSTPYEGGTFKLQIDFPETYPFKSPVIKFITKVYHPNVNQEKGEICADMYQKDWVPTKKARSVVELIISMLVAPNLDAPIEPAIAEEYRSDRKKFDDKARKLTLEHAKGTD